MSEKNKNYILQNNKKIDSNKLEVFPNTKKSTYKKKNIDKKEIRKKFNIPNSATVFIFGGNMGKPQYVDLLCYAIKNINNQKNIFFVFVGRGTERYKIEREIESEKLTNV